MADSRAEAEVRRLLALGPEEYDRFVELTGERCEEPLFLLVREYFELLLAIGRHARTSPEFAAWSERFDAARDRYLATPPAGP